MSDIDPYVRVLLLRVTMDLMEQNGHYRRSEGIGAIRDKTSETLYHNDGSDVTDVSLFAENFLEELVSSNVVRLDERKFAGEYVVYDGSRYQTFRSAALKGDPIGEESRLIGQRYFPDVFSGYLRERSGVPDDLPNLGLAPASNRVVTFSHNEISDFEASTTEVIDAVSLLNNVDEKPGLRELIVGQLKAGRELIRAGTVRAYLLELTLIQALRFLAMRYEKEVIGGLAAALIAALLKHAGVDA